RRHRRGAQSRRQPLAGVPEHHRAAVAAGISAASLLVFIGVFGAFSIPSLLGAAYPKAIAVVMSNEVLDRANWGLASALGTIVTALSAVLLYVYYRLIRRQEAALR